jgi:hypothetical protein
LGLPSYVINFDEIKKPIIDAINEAAISVSVGDVTLDSGSIKIDTSAIEASLDEIKGHLETVDSNSELVKTTAADILSSLNAHGESIDGHLGELGAKIESIITTMTEMLDLLEEIKQALASEGRQRILGESLAVPSVAGTYTKTWTIDKDILITGFTISQSAWNSNDKWSLNVGGTFPMFERVYTKMRGEHKQLSKFLPVPAGTPVTFSYDNTSSSNSKYVWADLEFMELESQEG